MKKLFLFMLVNLLCLSNLALAADVVVATPPEWLVMVMNFVASIPAVGPIFIEVVKWLGVVTAVMTTLSTAFLAITASLSAVLKVTGLVAAAAKVKEISDKVLPWLQYLSAFNVQKTLPKK